MPRFGFSQAFAIAAALTVVASTAGGADGDAGPGGHWSDVAPQSPPVPTVTDAAWPRHELDRFVLAALEARGIAPNGDADRATLLRRVTFDLTGLPPTPDEVQAFVADDAPDAHERVVDRLLASPRFGEAWGRHWLDVARYAESTGKTVNFTSPQAWRYRDWVIDAFNDDKPYDEFLREQIAGDLIPSDDPGVRAGRLIATGFLAIGPRALNERSGTKFELDLVDEQIDVVTQAFLGVTMACARCHDHRADPITMADYYALAGIFRSTETLYGTVPFINAQRPTALLDLPADADVVDAIGPLSAAERARLQGRIDSLRGSIMGSSDGLRQFFTAGQIALLRARLDAHQADGTAKLQAMGVRDKPAGDDTPRRDRSRPGPGGFTYDGARTIVDSPIFLRGEPDKPDGPGIPRGVPPMVGAGPVGIPSDRSGRLELAAAIADRGNPRTARVMVNRIWLHLFGAGIVPTPADFGVGGRPPTHPQLLDHLAIRFMDGGWSVKALVRHLVTSRTYRLASTARPEVADVDPDATLLWRMPPRRLGAESLRDAILAVSGQLDTSRPVGSVVALVGEGPVSQVRRGGDLIAAALDDPTNRHRSVYLPIIRDDPHGVLALFDAADPSLITAERQRTTVPAQGLFLMNSPFVLRAADAAVAALGNDGDEAARIDRATLRCYGRPAGDEEVAAARGFLHSYRDRLVGRGQSADDAEREAWSVFLQALFASAEFQFRR